MFSPDQINTAMGATGIAVNGTSTDMYDDSANIPDKDCRFFDPAEASVYTAADGPPCAHSTYTNPVTTSIMKSGRRSCRSLRQRRGALFHRVGPALAGLLASPFPLHRALQARRGFYDGADPQHRRHPEHH